MSFLKTSFYLFFCFLTFVINVEAMDGEQEDPPKHLSRFYTAPDPSDDDPWKEIAIESCQYFPTTSRISFNGDPVYSVEYNALNEEIKKRVCFLKNKTPPGKVNFLTAILSATGHKGPKVKRVYESLYVREEKGSPTPVVSQLQDNDKVLVFSSSEFDVNNHNKQFSTFRDFSPVGLKDEEKTHKLTHKLESNQFKSFYSLLNRYSFPEASLTGKYFKTTYDKQIGRSLSVSHTEPLFLSAIQTLPDNTFQKLLPDGYNLEYYEVHLISTFDACENCTKIVCKEMENLKQKFGCNLFIFFHSAKAYKSPYTIKYNQSITKASFDSHDLFLKTGKQDDPLNAKVLDKRKNVNFSTVPLYYIGILHALEGEEIQIKQ